MTEIEKVFHSSDESEQQDALDFKENMRLWMESLDHIEPPSEWLRRLCNLPEPEEEEDE